MALTTYDPLVHSSVNPIKALRESLGWTQAYLADQSGISRMALIRAEQGLFETPPVAPLKLMIARSSYLNVEALFERYREWVKYHRQVTGYSSLPVDFTSVLAGTNTDKHPLVRLRAWTGTSQIGFCKDLCVNPGPIYLWESWKQKACPAQLIDALIEAGISSRNIKALISCANEAWLL